MNFSEFSDIILSDKVFDLNGRRLNPALEKGALLMEYLAFTVIILVVATGYIMAIKKK